MGPPEEQRKLRPPSILKRRTKHASIRSISGPRIAALALRVISSRHNVRQSSELGKSHLTLLFWLSGYGQPLSAVGTSGVGLSFFDGLIQLLRG